MLATVQNTGGFHISEGNSNNFGNQFGPSLKYECMHTPGPSNCNPRYVAKKNTCKRHVQKYSQQRYIGYLDKWNYHTNNGIIYINENKRPTATLNNVAES